MSTYSLLFKCAAVLFVVLLVHPVCSGPINEAIVGSPYLFQEYDYPVDPYRSAKLSGAFQAANGRRGAKLVAYFGTGGLRSVERPAIPIHSYHK